MDQQALTAQMRTHSIIYAALGAGQLFTMLVIYMISSMNGTPQNPDLVLPLQIAVASLAAAGIGAGIFLYNSKATQARSSSMSVEQKFTQYRTACIIQWATCEGPALFSAVAYFMTGDATFLVLFGAILLYFLFRLRPSVDAFNRDFN